MADPNANQPKTDPETLILRASPRKVVRFKRNLLIGIAAIGAVAIFGTTWFALRNTHLLHRDDGFGAARDRDDLEALLVQPGLRGRAHVFLVFDEQQHRATRLDGGLVGGGSAGDGVADSDRRPRSHTHAGPEGGPGGEVVEVVARVEHGCVLPDRREGRRRRLRELR